jgi:anti-sigma factor RsiW
MIPDFDNSEHFELLSAYLDGELSLEETTKVESLLANNQDLQQKYQQLLKLRQTLQQLPSLSTSVSFEQLSQGVFTKVTKQRQGKRWLWGGSAIAALSVTALSGLFTPNSNIIPQLAQTRNYDQGLVVAINRISQEQLNRNLDHNLMIKLNEPLVDFSR